MKEYLSKAIETKDWFDAVVFTAIQVERYGCDRVRSYLKSINSTDSFTEAILDKIGLLTIGKCLRELQIVTKEEYKTIEALNVARNSFVHRTTIKSNYLMGTKGNIEYEPIVKEAIKLLEEKLDAVRLYASP